MGVIISPSDAIDVVAQYPNLRSPYPKTFIPKCDVEVLNNKKTIIRFDSVYDMSYWDYPENLAYKGVESAGMRRGNWEGVNEYMGNKYAFTKYKQDIYNQAMRELEMDKDFLNLVRKAKSRKRRPYLNKEDGELNIERYVEGDENCLELKRPFRSNGVLDVAFQVGTFSGGNYKDGIIKILKMVHMCNALKIYLNIDAFDSELHGVDNKGAYILVNVAKASTTPNLGTLLSIGEPLFFSYSLFNGYSHVGQEHGICGYQGTSAIIKDLGHRYDVIAGNLLNDQGNEMVSKVLKIAKII